MSIRITRQTSSTTQLFNPSQAKGKATLTAVALPQRHTVAAILVPVAPDAVDRVIAEWSQQLTTQFPDQEIEIVITTYA